MITIERANKVLAEAMDLELLCNSAEKTQTPVFVSEESHSGSPLKTFNIERLECQRIVRDWWLETATKYTREVSIRRDATEYIEWFANENEDEERSLFCEATELECQLGLAEMLENEQ